jgi:uncharacterized membrane protein
MTMQRKRTTWTDRLFRIAVVLKGLDGGFQLVAGIALLFIPARAIISLVQLIVTRDLVGNPAGMLATHLQSAVQNFTGGSTHTFVIVYLLVHAVIKLGLVVALLRNVAPAYPVAAVALGVFVVFEVLRAIRTHSVALPIFAALDVLIIVLVVREYVVLRRERVAVQGLAQDSNVG